MAGSALKRLMSEYKQLTLNPPQGIVSGPIDEENFFKWGVLIGGPEETPFGVGVFTARLSFPMDYPLNPPKMKFISDIFHPNNEEPRSIDYSSEESTKSSSRIDGSNDLLPFTANSVKRFAYLTNGGPIVGMELLSDCCSSTSIASSSINNNNNQNPVKFVSNNNNSIIAANNHSLIQNSSNNNMDNDSSYSKPVAFHDSSTETTTEPRSFIVGITVRAGVVATLRKYERHQNMVNFIDRRANLPLSHSSTRRLGSFHEIHGTHSGQVKPGLQQHPTRGNHQKE